MKFIVWEPRSDGQRHASTTSFGWNERNPTPAELNAVLEALGVEEQKVCQVLMTRSMIIADMEPGLSYSECTVTDVDFFKNYPKFFP